MTATAKDGGVYVTGRTYPFHQVLRQAGGEWLAEEKAWRFADPDQLAAVAAVLDTPAASGLAENQAPWRPKPGTEHRERVRATFMAAAPDVLGDEELLELLLFHAVPKRDTRPLAQALLRSFGDLHGVLAAEPARLAEVTAFDPATTERELAAVLFRLVRTVGLRAQAEGFKSRPVIDSPEELERYLETSLAQAGIEAFHALFLDAGNRLIRDECLARGTVDHTPLYPRELARRALELGAVAVILVHNHPSGDPTPSSADIATTRQVVDALAALNVTVYDHLIVGKGRITSFRNQGLL
ncbi:MAG: DNA repair protein RadC [Geminicoccaceae bacterium]|nr:MAG: DNA repair protein RadC [Geminicoccaceae bacterium]